MPAKVTNVNPRFGRRAWVKLWVNEWLDGTTRVEMSDSQRAFFIDLLAMAGRSRFPGVICAGQIDGVLVGYPLNKYQALMSEPIDVEATLALFERTRKIRVEKSDGPVTLYKVELLNWEKYQSEYQRQKPYRDLKLQRSNKDSYTGSNKTEVEGEGDVEREGENSGAVAPRATKDERLNVEHVKGQIEARRESIRAHNESPAERRRRLNQEAVNAVGGDVPKKSHR